MRKNILKWMLFLAFSLGTLSACRRDYDDVASPLVGVWKMDYSMGYVLKQYNSDGTGCRYEYDLADGEDWEYFTYTYDEVTNCIYVSYEDDPEVYEYIVISFYNNQLRLKDPDGDIDVYTRYAGTIPGYSPDYNDNSPSSSFSASKLNNTAWVYYKLEEYDARELRIEDETEFYNDLVSFYSNGDFVSDSYDWEDYDKWFVKDGRLCFSYRYDNDYDTFSIYTFKDKKEMVLRADFDFWEDGYHEKGYELFYFRYAYGD